MIWYFLIYLAGFILTARKIYWCLREYEAFDEDNLVDHTMGMMFPAIFAALFWPFALLGVVLIRPKLTMREVEEGMREIEEENMRLQNRIKELEEELGIHD